jgi:hypothetical protein
LCELVPIGISHLLNPGKRFSAVCAHAWLSLEWERAEIGAVAVGVAPALFSRGLKFLGNRSGRSGGKANGNA